MKVTVLKTAEEIGVAVAKIFTDEVKANPDCILGLATGASPIPTYNNIIKTHKEEGISFKGVKTYNLDEYCDLPKADKNSYYTFMHEQLFNSLDILEENVHFLDGNATDTDAECRRYDNEINEAGGIDIQLLGIGNNAHIGFNEPADSFTDGSFKVKLTDSTIEANKIYFDENPMPHYALTMGVNQIMSAKKIVLIATGPKKAEAVRNMIKGEVTPQVPASILQNHNDVEIFLDEAAASLL
ncbi:MAG: glucosamine-6-phosphate deaminase [Clostridia bacterium]|nr:glucosamine-6-phosphate deaminase [Clostridia bacterium]MBQ6837696.1 glucosamine-6-phosphate deaminase [Clostridia bacterium]